MFNNELMADVHFIVGPTGGSQKVPAHKVKRFHHGILTSLSVCWIREVVSAATEKNYLCSFIELSNDCVILPACVLTHLSPPSQYVLAVGSSVFCAMFYGDLAEEESEIHIPDVEPAAFLILLK